MHEVWRLLKILCPSWLHVMKRHSVQRLCHKMLSISILFSYVLNFKAYKDKTIHMWYKFNATQYCVNFVNPCCPPIRMHLFPCHNYPPLHVILQSWHICTMYCTHHHCRHRGQKQATWGVFGVGGATYMCSGRKSLVSLGCAWNFPAKPIFCNNGEWVPLGQGTVHLKKYHGCHGGCTPLFQGFTGFLSVFAT